MELQSQTAETTRIWRWFCTIMLSKTGHGKHRVYFHRQTQLIMGLSWVINSRSPDLYSCPWTALSSAGEAAVKAHGVPAEEAVLFLLTAD